MNGNDLLNGFNYIEENLIQEAEDAKRRRSPIIFRFIPIAASLIILVSVISISFRYKIVFQNEQPNKEAILEDREMIDTDKEQAQSNQEDIAESSVTPKEYKLFFNKAESMMASKIKIEGHFMEYLTTSQIEKLLPAISVKAQMEGIVNYSHVNENTSVFDVEVIANMDEKKINITLAPNQVIKCYVLAGNSTVSDIEGIKVEAGIFVTDKNSKGERSYIYFADFKIDDIAYYVEYGGSKEEETFFTNLIVDIISGEKADFSILENPAVPKLLDESLSEAQAYADADYGNYLPKIPKEYVLNDAKRFMNQEDDFLFASWSSGYLDVDIKISKLKEEEKRRLVSAEETVLYDMSLYPIPWADSMPADQYDIIQNPIFKLEDLTLDMLKMRGFIRSEQGESKGGTVCMNFSVLYDDILVELRTEGISPEYLFEELKTQIK